MSKPRSRFSQFSTCRQFGLAVILNVSALLSLCMFVLFFASSVHVFVFVINLYPLNRLLIVSQNLFFRLKQEEEEECDKDLLDLSMLSPLEQK